MTGFEVGVSDYIYPTEWFKYKLGQTVLFNNQPHEIICIQRWLGCPVPYIISPDSDHAIQQAVAESDLTSV